MSKTPIALIKNSAGALIAVRISGQEVAASLGGPADIGGTVGVNLFVDECEVMARLGGVDVPVHQVGRAAVAGGEKIVLGIKDADITFETRAP